MTDEKMTSLSELGEFGLIRKLTDDIILHHPGSRKGIGDDAAVIDHNGFLTLVTTDLLLEGIHFDLTYVPLKHLGYKSVVVNLSDIYAMNGKPMQVTMSIGLSAKISLGAIEDFYKGVKMACQHYEVDLVGGDTSASVNGLTISVTALGIARPDQVIYRGGAKKGDVICVTGNLGGAYMGLMLLEKENRKFRKDPSYQPQLEGHQYILGRQLKPEARNDLGHLLLSRNIKPSAMIDVSDGLSSDLLHICDASSAGCRILSGLVPIHPETAAMAEQLDINPLDAALNGGEDYELLFTIPPGSYASLQPVEGISAIGVITGRDEGRLVEMEDRTTTLMKAGGWNARQGWQ